MSDTEQLHDGIGGEKTPEVQSPQVIHQTIKRGGFMGGGWFTTALFLVAFFLVSYSLGAMSERNSKLTSLVGTAAGSQNAAKSNFNINGFKKAAADLKLDTKKFNACLDSGKFAADVKRETDEAVAIGVNGTPSFIINGVAVVGAQPIGVFKGIFGGTPLPLNPEASMTASLVDGKRVTSGISMDKVRVKGDKNAPITIVEYSDFECPYCGRFYEDTYKQLDTEYIKTGKVKIVFKDFPLSIHAQAPKAAEAGRCAEEQGKFWEMHDKLFELQLKTS
ncbi:MAG: DsbA family protein [bacterium]|nr:DsbA family protein [bacterium]